MIIGLEFDRAHRIIMDYTCIQFCGLSFNCIQSHLENVHLVLRNLRELLGKIHHFRNGLSDSYNKFMIELLVNRCWSIHFLDMIPQGV